MAQSAATTANNLWLINIEFLEKNLVQLQIAPHFTCINSNIESKLKLPIK